MRRSQVRYSTQQAQGAADRVTNTYFLMCKAYTDIRCLLEWQQLAGYVSQGSPQHLLDATNAVANGREEINLLKEELAIARAELRVAMVGAGIIFDDVPVLDGAL